MKNLYELIIEIVSEEKLFKILNEKVNSYNLETKTNVNKAYLLAQKFHEGQKRKEGTPYITHPLCVAIILAHMKADTAMLCAGLLHDVIEDTCCTKDNIIEVFGESLGEEIYLLVEGVSKFPNEEYKSMKDLDYANLRKLMRYIDKDARVIIVKLADRLHNMLTLKYMPSEKQILKAEETKEIYVPLANFIGAYYIRDELNDLAFKYLNPNKFLSITTKLNSLNEKHDHILKTMTCAISERLQHAEVLYNIKMNFKIIERFKNVSNIYELQRQGKELQEINDLIALKILVNSIGDCYVTLGEIHQLYKHKKNLIKDHIRDPKTNMYSAIHTTLFGPCNHLVQARIKTYEMDQNNLRGIIRYYDGNNNKESIQKTLQENYSFFQTLKDIDEYYGDNQMYVEQLYQELFMGRIYVYNDMNGDVVDLPVNSNIIDYLAAIGEDAFRHTSFVLVNNKIVPFNKILRSDDTVRFALHNEITNFKYQDIEASKTIRTRIYSSK